MNGVALRIVVLVSGRGSNLRAICAAIAAGSCRAHVTAVVADRAGTQAAEFAAEQGIPVHVVAARSFADRRDWDSALADTLLAERPDVVVLAGFMRILGERVLHAFAGRMVNVHPSLLPAFPGMDGPAQAITAGVKLAGCTVHVVDSGVDTGPILAQAAVPVLAEDDAATLHGRIQRAEHVLLPEVIQALALGALELLPVPRWRAQLEPADWFAWPRLEG